jgi:hypothetical protein
MGKALPFGEIKLASLQRPGTSAELFFGALAVLDIEARSEPFHDVPVFVTERHFAMQKRVIRSVTTPNARFGFERLAACQSRTPFLNYSVDVVWMNRFGPTPPTNLFEGLAK